MATLLVKHNKCNKNSYSKSKGCIVMPHMHGIGESFKNIFGKYGIQTYFKGNSTLKNILLSPKK